VDDKIKSKSDSFWRSATFKIIMIGLLILVLLIPAAMIKNLIRERETILEDAKRDIVSSWAGTQILIGPLLAVPYMEFIKKNNEVTEIKKYVYFLPEELKITGEISPQIRYRGIYKTILYSTDLSVNGYFTQPVFNDLDIKESDVYWEDAFLSLA